MTEINECQFPGLIYYSKDRVKHDSFRVFNAFVTRSSRVCMKRVLKRVDSRFSRYKRYLLHKIIKFVNGSISLLSVELINCCHLVNVEIDGFMSVPVLTDVVGLNCFVQ